MFSVVQTEDLAKAGMYLIKQQKNRYDDMNKLKKFRVGVDKPKMTLYNIDETNSSDTDASVIKSDSDTTSEEEDSKYGKLIV